MLCVYSVLLAVVHFDTVTGFNPMLTLDNCSRKSVTVTLSGGENNGIIYVHGQGVGCKQTTSSKPTAHTFTLNQCNIQWGETFRLVVQRKASYQTGEDKQIPVTCLADLGDLDVTNKIGIAAPDDEAEQTMYIKPSASMRLLKNGRSISGTPVSLGDVITMELRLHPDYENDFDIIAKSCSASSIPIIKDQCAVDGRLFPQFTRVSQGFLSSAFGAFRTTDLIGGAVTMTFTCTLKVCIGNCNASLCAGGHSGWGKHRRGLSSLAMRQNEENEEDIPLRDEIAHIEQVQEEDDANITTKHRGRDAQKNPKRSKTVADIHKTNKANGVKQRMYTIGVTIKRDISHKENNVSSIEKMAEVNDTDLDELQVQGTLTIAPDEDLKSVTAENTEICMNYGVSITLIVFMGVAFVGLGVTSWILLRRGAQKERQYDRKLPQYDTCEQDDYY